MTDSTITASEWLGRYAEKLGVAAPTEAEIETLLELAASAAHDSERIAAPIACWMAGATDVSLAELAEIAAEVAPSDADQ